MKRCGSILRAVLPLVFGVGLALPTGVSPPRVAAAAACPTGAVTFAELIRLGQDRGPLARRFPLPVTTVNERAHACLGSRVLHFAAFVSGPGGVGGASAYRLSPTWIAGPSLFLFGTSRRVDGLVEGPSLTAAVPPRLGNLHARYLDRWVLVTGRFGDPAARSCRVTGPQGETPSRAQAVQICQAVFVVSSIATLSAPPTTTLDQPTTSRPAPAATNPCPASRRLTVAGLALLRADDYIGPVAGKYATAPMVVSETGLACYGRRPLRVLALVRHPGPMGWEYLFGLAPSWFRTAEGLFVSAGRPPAEEEVVALAVPPALGDLQARFEGRWVTVTGHFDDPAATACVATGEAGLAPSAEEAIRICRSTFVVSAVTPAEAPSTTTATAILRPDAAVGRAWVGPAALLGGVLGLLVLGGRRRRR
jgi:hypothetical protein